MGGGPRGQRGIICWASRRMTYVPCTAKDTAPERQESPTITHLTGSRYTADKINGDHFLSTRNAPQTLDLCVTLPCTLGDTGVYICERTDFVFNIGHSPLVMNLFRKTIAHSVILWMNCFNLKQKLTLWHQSKINNSLCRFYKNVV